MKERLNVFTPMKIDNYFEKELEKIFEKHISEEATVVTDK